MANDARTFESLEGPTVSMDAESLVTALEKSLRSDPKPTDEAEAEIRARLLDLYLADLRDPLSAALHAEALLDRDTIDKSVLEAAAILVEHKPLGERIAAALPAAYALPGDGLG